MKYIGKFRDLMPMGFKFHKLYARNYRVYEKNEIWIWVMTGYIQFKNLSGPFLDTLMNMVVYDYYPTYKETLYIDLKGKIPLMRAGEPKGCIIDKDTGEFIASDVFMGKYISKFNKDLDKYYEFRYGSDRFEEFIINESQINLFKLLHERNMVEWERKSMNQSQPSEISDTPPKI